MDLIELRAHVAIIYENIKLNFNIISAAYNSQGNHTSQLEFCNWLADGSTMEKYN